MSSDTTTENSLDQFHANIVMQYTTILKLSVFIRWELHFFTIFLCKWFFLIEKLPWRLSQSFLCRSCSWGISYIPFWLTQTIDQHLVHRKNYYSYKINIENSISSVFFCILKITNSWWSTFFYSFNLLTNHKQWSAMVYCLSL